jgi:hypothetical protein
MLFISIFLPYWNRLLLDPRPRPERGNPRTPAPGDGRRPGDDCPRIFSRMAATPEAPEGAGVPDRPEAAPRSGTAPPRFPEAGVSGCITPRRTGMSAFWAAF